MFFQQITKFSENQSQLYKSNLLNSLYIEGNIKTSFTNYGDKIRLISSLTYKILFLLCNMTHKQLLCLM